MKSNKPISRRTMLAAGTAAAAVAAVSHNPLAADREPGETRVLFLVGDYWHNGTAQESHWRRVLAPADWNLMFAQSSEFVTPEALDKADMFVVCRYAGPDSLGWSPEPVIKERPQPAPFMTDEQQDAIVANVERGMGLISMHCSIWNPERAKYMSLLGVEEPVMHGPIQPVTLHGLNENHPITQGLGPIETGDDEVFDAVLKPGDSTLLFKSTGSETNRERNGGWAREQGEGRVVALLPGHTQFPYHTEGFKKIMWRSAHWAMNREIGPEGHLEKGY